MSSLIDNIKEYFSNKDKKDDVAPKGMCPTCWGFDEWDNQYYEVIKDKHLLPNNDQYESFISKIVDKHVATTHKHENKYICTTCNKTI